MISLNNNRRLLKLMQRRRTLKHPFQTFDDLRVSDTVFIYWTVFVSSWGFVTVSSEVSGLDLWECGG